ncbi:hypothetical protein niasHT_027338 [Heterodera trifolii]|uniref:Protein kinase domain-containing protein n=1 Tax=Heterodera trifolii TaxID=157864 RepID=A0ABD2JTP1_9BILA
MIRCSIILLLLLFVSILTFNAVDGMAGDALATVVTLSIGQSDGSSGTAQAKKQLDREEEAAEVAKTGETIMYRLFNLSRRKLISPPLSPTDNKKGNANSDDQPTNSHVENEQKSGIFMADYWQSVQKFFHKGKSEGTQKFVLEVPAKVMAKILIRMINAFLEKNSGKKIQKTETISVTIPQPQNFMVHPKRHHLDENELVGNVRVTYGTDFFSSNFYDFYYKSPQQINNSKSKDNLNKKAFEEADIVWAFGVIIYEMLTDGENPFEGLRERLVDANDPYKGIGIQKLSMHYSIYVDDEGKMWGGGKKLEEKLHEAIASLVEKGEEVPIPYEQTMPGELAICDKRREEGAKEEEEEEEEKGEEEDEEEDEYVCVNGYEPLISLTKQCLQTYKEKRITMNELRDKLKEIAMEK